MEGQGMDLYKIAEQGRKRRERIRKLLAEYRGKTMMWQRQDGSYFILSKSTKKEGYQLTYFLKDEPLSDMIRKDFCDDDFINELAIHRCKLVEVI